jgi:hypothetical protein
MAVQSTAMACGGAMLANPGEVLALAFGDAVTWAVISLAKSAFAYREVQICSCGCGSLSSATLVTTRAESTSLPRIQTCHSCYSTRPKGVQSFG